MQCIRNKIEHLEILLKSDNIDIACFTEHWLKNYETKTCNISGYSLCSIFCRSNFNNGGTAIFCKNDLKNCIKTIDCLKKFCAEKIIEVCGIEITLPKKIIKVISLYRSPVDSNLELFFKELDKILHLVCSNNKAQIIFCGDLNIDQLNSDNAIKANAKKELLDLFFSYNINVLVDQPTRIYNNSSSIIDYMCTNGNSTDFKCDVQYNALSDHSAQILNFNIFAESFNMKTYFISRSLSKHNYDTFLSYISKESWHEIYSCQYVNEGFEMFVGILKHYTDIAFPFKNINTQNKSSKKSWITTGIYISSQRLKELYNRMIFTKDLNDVSFYKKYKHIYRNVLKAAKKKYNDDLYLKTENKSKAAWKIINSTTLNTNNNHKNVTEINIGDKKIYGKGEIAQHFNSFFINMPKRLYDQILDNAESTELPYNTNFPTMFIDPVSETEIYNIIMGLKNSNSVGVDGISANILKYCAYYIVAPLTYLVNLLLVEGIFPGILKVAKVIPVYKKGDRLKVENYRPISLLSTLSKIIERVIFNRIMDFITKYEILHDAQHGFRKKKSTQTAIFSFLNKLYDNLDNGNKTIGLFMDLSKAFDLVDHELLLEKLNAYGMRGKINNLVRTYLTGRSQLVEIDKIRSQQSHIECGVPQGSVLGPLLFLLFVNDLPTIAEGKLVMFADDNSLIYSEKDISGVIKNIQILLNRFTAWFTKSKLFLNTDKTQFINFTPRAKKINESYLIKNNGKSIAQVSEVKFLGIYLENNVEWETHIDVLCKKLSPACYALYRLRELSNKQVMLSYYYAQIYSKIKYVIIFWGCSHHSIRVFRLQKRAIRSIMGVSRLTSCKPLLKELKLLTVACILELLLFVRENPENFTKNNMYHDYNTRAAEKLCTPIHNLSVFERSPIYVGIQVYNKLPEHLKLIQNIKSFRNHVTDFLVHECFYTVSEYLNY